MEEIKIKGIVVKSKDYKDSDKIVTIFSAEKGLISARVRGVKKNKAKLVFAVQPFAFVEFVLVCRDNFYTVINATSIDQFFDITADFDKYILMLACLEVIEKSVKENSQEPELFLLLLSILKAVCYDGVSPMVAFIKFMLDALNCLGLKVETKYCASCSKTLHKNVYNFSYEFNGLLCGHCSEKFQVFELSENEFKLLRSIDSTEIAELSSIQNFSSRDMTSLISLLTKNFRLLTDEEIITINKFL